jgi:hypothetical protein
MPDVDSLSTTKVGLEGAEVSGISLLMEKRFLFCRMESKTRYTGAIVYWSLWIVFICFYMYFDNIDAYRNSEKVKGKVVDILVGRGYKRGYYNYPQIEFNYRDSLFLFGQSRGWIGAPSIGDSVTVIFPKGEPGKAERYLFLPYWVSLTALFFSFMIAGFLFVIPIFVKWYNDFKKHYKNSA